MNVVECLQVNGMVKFILTDEMKDNYNEFEEIWEQIKE